MIATKKWHDLVWLLLAGMILAGSAPRVWAAPGVTAWLDRDTVAAGENVILSLTFEGAAPASAPNLPPLPNLQLISVGTSSAMNIVNGVTTTQTAFNYTLVAGQVGDVVIPAMQFRINNQVLRTDALTLKVTKPPELPASATNTAFLKLVLPKTDIYRGEVLPVEIVLYVIAGNNAQMPQLAGQGFTVGNMVQQPQRRVRVGNQQFLAAPFKTYVTAARDGALTLGPASMALQIPAPNARRSIFGEIVDWQRVTLISELYPIQVRPLPVDNVPPGFNGAVGSYTLIVSAGPTNLSVGDPITVKVALSGKGFLDSLNLPEQTQWREFKTYPPSSTLESADPHRLVGTKSFEQVVIPLNHEIKVLPPFRFPYFDIEQRSYRVLSNQFIPLLVRASASANVPTQNRTNIVDRPDAPPVDDILHLKAQVQPHPGMTGPLLSRGWFLALQGIPFLTWLGLLMWRKRYVALANNPRRQRQRAVDQRIQQGLRELRTLANAQKGDEFHATLFRLLQERLGERLDLPASAITEAIVTERLGTQLSETAQRDVHDLFQACNQARYASENRQVELTALLAKAEKALHELQSLKA